MKARTRYIALGAVILFTLRLLILATYRIELGAIPWWQWLPSICGAIAAVYCVFRQSLVGAGVIGLAIISGIYIGQSIDLPGVILLGVLLRSFRKKPLRKKPASKRRVSLEPLPDQRIEHAPRV